jgi:hypothetical protein
MIFFLPRTTASVVVVAAVVCNNDRDQTDPDMPGARAESDAPRRPIQTVVLYSSHEAR